MQVAGLARALRSNTSLRVMDLRHCPLLGDEGLAALELALPFCGVLDVQLGGEDEGLCEWQHLRETHTLD